MKIFLYVVSFVFLSNNASFAFEETGSATINTSNYGSFEDNKQQIINAAVDAACLNILDKYTDTFSTARLTNFDKIKNTIENNLKDYINCGDPIDENLDFATNEFSSDHFFCHFISTTLELNFSTTINCR